MYFLLYSISFQSDVITKFIIGCKSPTVMKSRTLLLYSGGLDTSVMIKWLQDQLNCDVVTLTLDIGQEKNNLNEIALKAKQLGATDTITRDVRDIFSEAYISKAIMSDALYEGKYPLSTSLARPLMAKEAVEVANLTGCDTIVHGSTGKGNDQVRFEVSIRALDDSIKVIAPVRDMNMNRDEEIEYAARNGIEIPYGGKYSVDENLWGRSVEGSTIEDITREVPFDAFKWVVPPEKASDSPEKISLLFEKGVPAGLNDTRMSLTDVISSLNRIAGMNGIGAIEMMEDRVVGIKSHEFYECPAALTILAAHNYLASAVLNRKELSAKSAMDGYFSDFVYSGLWFDPVMDHIGSFEESINSSLTGTVSMKLYKGNIIPAGVDSSNSLYDISMSSYGRNQSFDQGKAPGFIYIFGNETRLTRSARNRMVQQAEIRA